VEVLLLPKLKGRTAERASLFREHIFAGIVDRQSCADGETGSYWDHSANDLDDWRDLAWDEVNRMFAEQRAATYHAEEYLKFARSFLNWYGGYSELRKAKPKRRMR
jgi:hypothetical protein